MPVALNTSSPQYDGLLACWPLRDPDGSFAEEPVGGRHAAQDNVGKRPSITSADPLGDWTCMAFYTNSLRATDAATALNPTAAVSCSAWCRMTENAPFGRVLSTRNNSSGYAISVTGLQPRFFVGNGSALTTAAASSNMTVGVWYHLAGTYKASGKVRFYVNGSLVAEVNAPATVTYAFPYHLMIGSDYTGLTTEDNHIRARLSDVRVYGKELTSAEVAAMYALETRWQLYEAPDPGPPASRSFCGGLIAPPGRGPRSYSF